MDRFKIVDTAKNVILDIECDPEETAIVVDEGGPNQTIINFGTLRQHGLHATQAHAVADQNQSDIAELTSRVAALEALHED